MRFRVKRGGPAAGFTFDRTAKTVQRPEPEKPVSLAQALDNPYGRYYGKARSREELLKVLWQVEWQTDPRAVDDLVKRLRRKLRQRQGSIRIETVWGYGFRLSSAEE